MNNENIPQHLAFIMDGNRRWARSHKLQLFKGHNRGAEQIEKIVEAAAKKGIQYTTFWAFSTENWNREKEEVETLLKVFRHGLSGPVVRRMIKKGVKLQVIGDYSAFPPDIVKQVEDLIERSKNNNRITATIALSYGGRAEVLGAVNAILKSAKVQERKSEKVHSPEIDEETFSSYLYTRNQPDPDMIIRTGGEQRLSGFLPWQAVYSELYFTETFWPDFDEKEFDKALEEFAHRQRRFGK